MHLLFNSQILHSHNTLGERRKNLKMQFSMLPSKTIPDADEKLVHSQLQPNSTIHKNTNHMMGPLECENVTPQASNSIPTTCGDEPMEEKLTLTGKAKKAAVAFSGGALVVCGIPLIPFPGTQTLKCSHCRV